MIDKIKIDKLTSEPKKPHLRGAGKLVGKKKPRVIIAMSGGVDSSVSAAILKKQGFDVIGIFMKFWAEDREKSTSTKENICCSVEAVTAARAVAEKLKIPFYVVNFADEFKKTVVDYYVSEYENGRTPNPCVICNRDIKGEILMRKVLELNGDYLATGHYAQVVKLGSRYRLLKGKDQNKDQTYFLWTLTQEKLAKLLFPVGDLTKPEVRKLAKKFNLPTAERRESQGICFIPDRDVSGFLHRHAKKLTKPGPVVSIDGEILGQHNGLINYTIGQREGLGLGGPKAYYVVELKSKENTLVVGDEKDLYQKSLIATGLNWIDQSTDYSPQTTDIEATIRYGHPAEKCQIEFIDNNKVKVNFRKPQRAITAGQSIVFYSGDELLGGGVIEKIV